jgi:hypothetical protein
MFKQVAAVSDEAVIVYAFAIAVTALAEREIAGNKRIGNEYSGFIGRRSAKSAARGKKRQKQA